MDERRELPRLERRIDVTDKSRENLCLLLRCAAAESRADNAQVLAPKKVHVNSRLGSCHRGERYPPSAIRHGRYAFAHERPAHGVDCDIRRILRKGLHEIVLEAVRDNIRADALAESAVFVTRDLGNDFRAEDVLRELDCRNAKPALTAVDEERLALLYVADDPEVEVRRRIDFGNARRLPEVKALRHRHDHPLGHDDALSVSAAAEKCADMVADIETSVRRAL